MKPAPAAAAETVSPALYGAYEELSRAAGAGARVIRAVFPLCRPANPFLTESQRDALWEMFQAPVCALMLDGRGDVVGYECETQEGLHLRADYAAGLPAGEIESKLCECGRPGPRLMPPAGERTKAGEIPVDEPAHASVSPAHG